MPSRSASGQAVRARLGQFVREHPGAHFRHVQRSLGLSPGQATHHIHRLLADGVLVAKPSGRYVHYFPSGGPRDSREALAVLQHVARRDLAGVLCERGPRTMRQLANATGSPVSTLHHHLRLLERAGVVGRQGPRPARYTLTGPGRAALDDIHAEPRNVLPPVPLTELDRAWVGARPRAGPLPETTLTIDQ